MSGSDTDFKKRICTWDCPLADMGKARSRYIAGYLIETSRVYCRLMKGVDMGSVCPIFPRAEFDLSQIEERYFEHART